MVTYINLTDSEFQPRFQHQMARMSPLDHMGSIVHSQSLKLQISIKIFMNQATPVVKNSCSSIITTINYAVKSKKNHFEKVLKKKKLFYPIGDCK